MLATLLSSYAFLYPFFWQLITLLWTWFKLPNTAAEKTILLTIIKLSTYKQASMIRKQKMKEIAAKVSIKYSQHPEKDSKSRRVPQWYQALIYTWGKMNLLLNILSSAWSLKRMETIFWLGERVLTATPSRWLMYLSVKSSNLVCNRYRMAVEVRAQNLINKVWKDRLTSRKTRTYLLKLEPSKYNGMNDSIKC